MQSFPVQAKECPSQRPYLLQTDVAMPLNVTPARAMTGLLPFLLQLEWFKEKEHLRNATGVKPALAQVSGSASLLQHPKKRLTHTHGCSQLSGWSFTRDRKAVRRHWSLVSTVQGKGGSANPFFVKIGLWTLPSVYTPMLPFPGAVMKKGERLCWAGTWKAKEMKERSGGATLIKT